VFIIFFVVLAVVTLLFLWRRWWWWWWWTREGKSYEIIAAGNVECRIQYCHHFLVTSTILV
jgi:hypothetical protein